MHERRATKSPVHQKLISGEVFLPRSVKVEDGVRELSADSDAAFTLPNAKFQHAEVRQRSQAYLDGVAPLDFYG